MRYNISSEKTEYPRRLCFDYGLSAKFWIVYKSKVKKVRFLNVDWIDNCVNYMSIFNEQLKPPAEDRLYF